jgi:hypothetical protein
MAVNSMILRAPQSLSTMLPMPGQRELSRMSSNAVPVRPMFSFAEMTAT